MIKSTNEIVITTNVRVLQKKQSKFEDSKRFPSAPRTMSSLWAAAHICDITRWLSEEYWDETLTTNLKAPFFLAQAAAKHFIKRGGGGKIVNITSIWAEVGFPLFSAYCAAKGGLLLMTRALTSEWGQYGINVNAVGPTLNITDMTRELAEDEEFSRDYIAQASARAVRQPSGGRRRRRVSLELGLRLRVWAAIDG